MVLASLIYKDYILNIFKINSLFLFQNAIREWRTIKGSEFVTIKQFFDMFDPPQANQPKKREAQEDDESVKEQAEKRFKPIGKNSNLN